jgi:hypothetical protein
MNTETYVNAFGAWVYVDVRGVPESGGGENFIYAADVLVSSSSGGGSLGGADAFAVSRVNGTAQTLLFRRKSADWTAGQAFNDQ